MDIDLLLELQKIQHTFASAAEGGADFGAEVIECAISTLNSQREKLRKISLMCTGDERSEPVIALVELILERDRYKAELNPPVRMAESTSPVKALQVFGGAWAAEERRIVACTSLTKAAELTGCTRTFLCETGNELEVALALNNPNVVYGYNTRKVKSVKDASEYKVILDKKRPVHQQPSLSCDSGCGSPAVKWFKKTSVITCGSSECVEVQNERWKVHCAE